MEHMQIVMLVVWIAVTVVGVIVEAMGPQLVSIWFAVAGMAALIANICGMGPLAQFIFFVILSAILVAATRPLARKLAAKGIRTNVDALAGETCVVTERIDNIEAAGQCKVKGQIWSARSEDGAPIEEGTLVNVVSVEGVKLIVRRQSAPQA